MNRILESKNNLVIIREDEKTSLYSYKTWIATFNSETKELQLNNIYWDYSRTTLKQLKDFINYYTCYTYASKKDFTQYMEHCQEIYKI